MFCYAFKSIRVRDISKLIEGLFIWAKLSRLPRKHFDRSNNFVLFIWGNVFPLTGYKVSCFDVDVVKCKQIKVFPLNGKVVFR